MLKNKLILSAAMTAMLALFTTGCSEKQIEVSTEHHKVLEGAPQWVLSPKQQGYVVGIGSAQFKEEVSFQFQREEAMLNARADLTKKIMSNFNNVTKGHYSQHGTGNKPMESKAFETTSKNVAKRNLAGSEQLNIWISPETGELFVLVGVPEDKVDYSVEKAIESIDIDSKLQ